MPEILILCGPPGSGKSTLRRLYPKHVAINQDELGKEGHLNAFNDASEAHHDILIDRMNFSKQQRERYLKPAKEVGYKTKIIVLHENYDTCLKRMKLRENHPTIKDEETSKKVLNFFFSKYERVEDNEADIVERKWPEGNKPLAVICDLDGTLCNIDHRLHYVRREGKKDWKSFFENLKDDTVNDWCKDILSNFYRNAIDIVLCSGRTDNYRNLTQSWLEKHGIFYNNLFWLEKHRIFYNNLFMRYDRDFRQDYIAKEILLDFEILSRYQPYFFIDDRCQVVEMYRKRGFTVLQCAPGNF